MSAVCDCDPVIHSDGSKTHDPECPLYPWCPHELAYACLMPCGCPCGPCRALDPQ